MSQNRMQGGKRMFDITIVFLPTRANRLYPEFKSNPFYEVLQSLLQMTDLPGMN